VLSQTKFHSELTIRKRASAPTEALFICKIGLRLEYLDL
jgi:hypothetical protein